MPTSMREASAGSATSTGSIRPVVPTPPPASRTSFQEPYGMVYPRVSRETVAPPNAYESILAGL